MLLYKLIKLYIINVVLVCVERVMCGATVKYTTLKYTTLQFPEYIQVPNNFYEVQLAVKLKIEFYLEGIK